MTAHRWRIAALVTLLAWCAFELAVRRTPAITDDWQGWRQADTQAIARNFLREEADPRYPRIDWRGDGPGYVESEAQLYPALIAAAMHVTGESVWPGQLLSLACIALAAAVLFAALARRFGEGSAYLALVATLTMQGTVVVATSIQPDPLAFLGFTVGAFAFLDWLDAPTRRRWFTWVAATALAGLVKPTTLELGLVQGVFVLLARRAALRDPKLWIGWGLVVAAVAAYLVHAHRLYTDYGNTFGVLVGGDSKLPVASMLRDVTSWRELVRYDLVWGTGLLAVPAALYLAWRRRLGAEAIALAAGAIALDVLAFRYTSGPFGTHYHLPHVVLGAWLVAQALGDLAQHRPRWLRVVAFAATALAVIGGARAIRFVHRVPAEPETALGERLATLAPPGTLVAVRARAERYNEDWHTTNNFEDPRIFYLSRTKGFVLANDDRGASALADAVARGARYYVHVHQYPIDAELRAWLAGHATLVYDDLSGSIFRMNDASPPAPTAAAPDGPPRVIDTASAVQRWHEGVWKPPAATFVDAVQPGDVIVVVGIYWGDLPPGASTAPTDDRGTLAAVIDQGPATVGRVKPPVFAQLYVELDPAPGRHTITPPYLGGPAGDGSLSAYLVRGLRERRVVATGQARVDGVNLLGLSAALDTAAQPGDLLLAIGGYDNTQPAADATIIAPRGWQVLGYGADGVTNLPCTMIARVADRAELSPIGWTWNDPAVNVAVAAVAALR